MPDVEWARRDWDREKKMSGMQFSSEAANILLQDSSFDWRWCTRALVVALYMYVYMYLHVCLAELWMQVLAW